ncbi:hypothetical protein ILUMI_13782 [Ignelater luminosus]|uniref:Peptidase S1 domain-containing protein n=1 Tax=Ignelater luminosus TaxID=2038154 RepID=A0A8K0CRQ0_IGNLU|nr:hypothetical protein ILUMI_13782 [Ignelater luminosus]
MDKAILIVLLVLVQLTSNQNPSLFLLNSLSVMFSHFGVNMILLVVITIILPGPSKPYSSDAEDKIIGGNDIPITKVPFVLCLATPPISPIHRPIHVCGASIIKKHWAITAAHCVDSLNDTKDVYIRGNTSYSDGRDSHHNIHTILKLYIHNRYNTSNPYFYDIALLQVKEPFNALYEKPIPLSGDHYKYKPDTAVTTFGWGVAVVTSVTFSPTLKTANLFLLDHGTCMWLYGIWYGGNLDNRHICVGGKLNKNICIGDSGGALVQNGKLIGVASWSAGECANNVVPVIFVRLSKFYNWIKERVTYRKRK